MTLYLINSPILTDYGRYDFSPLTIAQAQALVKNGFVSAVGHEASASLLSNVLNMPIPANRIQIKLEVGDEAVILRLKTRLPEGKILTESELAALPFELGLLRHLA